MTLFTSFTVPFSLLLVQSSGCGGACEEIDTKMIA